MAYFEIVLDTVGPSIEIHTPNYVLSSADLDIVIEGNEELDGAYQSFRLIDSFGQPHTFILSHHGHYFKGTVSLHGIPLGITKIEAEVRDKVDNISPLITKSINIIQGKRIKISSENKVREIRSNKKLRPILSSLKIRDIKHKSKAREIGSTSKTRTIKAVLK